MNDCGRLISAEEARAKTTNCSSAELAKLNCAINELCNAGEHCLCLQTGLTPEAALKQHYIYPDFTGSLHQETLEVLDYLGYTIEKTSSHQGETICISW